VRGGWSSQWRYVGDNLGIQGRLSGPSMVTGGRRKATEKGRRLRRTVSVMRCHDVEVCGLRDAWSAGCLESDRKIGDTKQERSRGMRITEGPGPSTSTSLPYGTVFSTIELVPPTLLSFKASMHPESSPVLRALTSAPTCQKNCKPSARSQVSCYLYRVCTTEICQNK
jgi:hypothetical protein